MAVITVYLEVDDKKAVQFNLTDSVPFTDLVPLLKKHIQDFPDKFDLCLKLSPNRSLADYGINDDDIIVIRGPKLIAEPLDSKPSADKPVVEPVSKNRRRK